MRVIFGKYGGRKLTPFKPCHIRPTTDYVKEMIFNVLSESVRENSVLDLFSGTGGLGIEALSRGAKKTYFVDSSHISMKILRKNLQHLGIIGSHEIQQIDIFRFLRQCNKAFDLILIDPPFTKKIAHQVMESVAKSKTFHPGSSVVIEFSRDERLQNNYGSLFLYKKKEMKDKKIYFYRGEKCFQNERKD